MAVIATFESGIPKPGNKIFCAGFRLKQEIMFLNRCLCENYIPSLF